MSLLSNIFGFLRKNVLDRTDIDEKITGAVKNFIPQQQPQIQRSPIQFQPQIRPPVMPNMSSPMSGSSAMMQQSSPITGVLSRINLLKQKLSTASLFDIDKMRKDQINNIKKEQFSFPTDKILAPVSNFLMDKKLVPTKQFTSGGGSYSKRGIDVGAMMDNVVNSGLKALMPGSQLNYQMTGKQPIEQLSGLYNKAIVEPATKVNPMLGRISEIGPYIFPGVFQYNVAKQLANLPAETTAIGLNRKTTPLQKVMEFGGREVLPLLSYKYAPKLMKKLVPEQTYNKLSKILGGSLTHPSVRELITKAAMRGGGTLPLINAAHVIKAGMEQGDDPKTIAKNIAISTPEAIIGGGIFGAAGEGMKIAGRPMTARERPQTAGLLSAEPVKPVRPKPPTLNEIMKLKTVIETKIPFSQKPIQPKKSTEPIDWELQRKQKAAEMTAKQQGVPQMMEGIDLSKRKPMSIDEFKKMYEPKKVYEGMNLDKPKLNFELKTERERVIADKVFNAMSKQGSKNFNPEQGAKIVYAVKQLGPETVEKVYNKYLKWNKKGSIGSTWSELKTEMRKRNVPQWKQLDEAWWKDVLKSKGTKVELSKVEPKDIKLAEIMTEKPKSFYEELKSKYPVKLYSETGLPAGNTFDLGNGIKVELTAKEHLPNGTVLETNTEGAKTWYLERISSKIQGKGNATKALNNLITLADKYNITLKVEPKPYGDIKGLNAKELQGWYEKKGFIHDKGIYWKKTPGVQVTPIARPLGKPLKKDLKAIMGKGKENVPSEPPEFKANFEEPPVYTKPEYVGGLGLKSAPPKPPEKPPAGSDYETRKIEGAKIAEETVAKTKENEGYIKRLLETNINEKEANKTRATKDIEPLTKIDKKQADAFMKAVQDPKKQADFPEHKGIFAYTKKLTDEAFKLAKDAGIYIDKKENYFPQKWKTDINGQFRIGQRTLSRNFSHAKKRVIESIEKGQELGYEYYFDTPAEAMENYLRYLYNTAENYRTVASLKKSGLIVPEALGKGQKDMVRLNVLGLPESKWTSPEGKEYIGSWYAEKSLAYKLNKLWGEETHSKTLERAGRFSQASQDYGLSAGVPSTPANFFTFTQIIYKDIPYGIFAPMHLKDSFDAFRQSFTQNTANKEFSKMSNSIIEMQKRGVAVNSSYTAKNLVENKILNNYIGSSKNIPDFMKETWGKMMNQATFARFMCLKKVKTFKRMSDSMIKKGIPQNKAFDIAAEAVRYFDGEKTLYEQAFRNKNVKNFLSLGFLAPRYRESTIGTGVNIFKSIKPENWSNPAYGPVRALLLGSLIMHVGGEILNYLWNDNFTWDNESSLKGKLKMPVGKLLNLEGKKKDMVLGIPLPSQSSLTALQRSVLRTGKHLIGGETVKAYDEAVGNVAYWAQPLARVFANRQFTGQPIVEEYDADKLEKEVKFLAKSYTHPLEKARQDIMNPEADEIGKAKGISEGLEMPFRIYDQKKLTNSYYFEGLDKYEKGLTAEQAKDWNALKRPKAGTEISDYANNFADQSVKANLYLRNPDFLKRELDVAKYVSEKTGQPINPLLLLTEEQQKVVMRLKTLPPQNEDKTNLTNKNIGWLKEYWEDQTEYGNKMTELGIFSNDEAEGSINTLNVRPSKELQKKLDFYNTLPKGTGARSKYIKANPDILKYFEENSNANDIKRLLLGLEPKGSTSGYSSGYGGKSGYKGYGSGSKFNYKLYYELKNIMSDYTGKNKMTQSLDTILKKKPKYKKLADMFKNEKKIDIHKPLNDIIKEYEVKLFGKKKKS